MNMRYPIRGLKRLFNSLPQRAKQNGAFAVFASRKILA